MTNEELTASIAAFRDAEAASSWGPWVSEVEHIDNVEDGDEQHACVCGPETVCDATVIATMGEYVRYNTLRTIEQKQADAAFIAAAKNKSPAIIDALVKRVEALRECLAKAFTDPDRLKNSEAAMNEAATLISGTINAPQA